MYKWYFTIRFAFLTIFITKSLQHPIFLKGSKYKTKNTCSCKILRWCQPLNKKNISKWGVWTLRHKILGPFDPFRKKVLMCPIGAEMVGAQVVGAGVIHCFNPIAWYTHSCPKIWNVQCAALTFNRSKLMYAKCRLNASLNGCTSRMLYRSMVQNCCKCKLKSFDFNSADYM